MSAKTPAKFTYDYPRPAMTVDVAVVTTEKRPRILLIRRKNDPFAGCWAFPGGFVDEGETIQQAAVRELQEETGLTASDLVQLFTAGDPGRDPRGWTVSVLHLARVKPKDAKAVAADDAAEVEWHRLDELPPMAFDHAALMEKVRAAIKQPGEPAA
jgi:8-oxo-dGTP diphosphatase